MLSSLNSFFLFFIYYEQAGWYLSWFGYVLYPTFSIFLVYMGGVLGLLIFYLSYARFKYAWRSYALLYLYFLGVVYFLVSTSHIFYFFFFYELLFVPSFLLVYFVSPNRRSVFASIYFFFWTQSGSLLVLLGFLGIYTSTGIALFPNLYLASFYLNTFELNLLGLLVLFGFGVKIPMWPFHYWLTKTHVEAPTFFSIYLSGFLVKTALYGLFLYYSYYPSIFCTHVFIGLITFGVYDATIKMWAQTDLKKLVAYGTVQEMNLITICFLLGGSYATSIGVLFCLTHTLLSTLFFYIVEIIYRNFKTRTQASINGLWVTSPTLSIHILVAVMLYTGFPFTLKFLSEVNVFLVLLQYSWWQTFFLIIILQAVGSAVWIKIWLGILYGNPTGSTARPIILSTADMVVLGAAYMHLILGSFFLVY